MKKEETKEDININIKILLNIFKNILDNSYKQKADTFTNCCHCKVHVLVTILSNDPKNVEKDKQAKLEEYYN
jgi:hypothetical protein